MFPASLRVVSVLALILLLPAGVAAYLARSQQDSLEVRVREGRAILKASGSAGVSSGLGTALDDFKPLPEAVRLNVRNLWVLHALQRLNLIAAFAALTTIFVMTLVSAMQMRTGRELRGGPVMLGVTVLASVSFLLHGVSLIALLVGFELWIFGGITWMFASAWGIAAIWGVVQARLAFHLPELFVWWSPSGLLLIWRATLAADGVYPPSDADAAPTLGEDGQMTEFAARVFRPDALIVRALCIWASVPLLLMGAALWLQQRASTNLVAWQPPILEPWLPNPTSPAQEWVGEALTGDRLYEPHIVRARTRVCIALAATVYSLGLLIFGIVMAYRRSKTSGSRSRRMILSRAVPHALRFSTILLPLTALACIALVWCVEVLALGAMLWMTPAAMLVSAVGFVAFSVAHLGPDDIAPEEPSVRGIVLEPSTGAALCGLISEIAFSAGIEPPGHVVAVVDLRTAVVAPPLWVDGACLSRPAVLISLPMCRILSVSELTELLRDSLIDYSDAAPAYATRLADRLEEAASLNAFTAPARLGVAPVTLLARLAAAPVAINPDPDVSLLGHARYKEVAGSLIWAQMLTEAPEVIDGDGCKREHKTIGAEFAAVYANAGFDLKGPDRRPAASLVPDFERLELSLESGQLGYPADPR